MKESLIESTVVFSSKFKAVLDLLDADDQLLLLSNAHIRHCKPGCVIYAEGDRPEQLHFLNKGKVKIFKKGNFNKNQIIRLIKEGWFFGYRALLAEDHFYQAAAEAFDAAEVISVPKDLINMLIRKNHQLSTLFIHILASDLAKSNEHTISLTQKHLRGRLANALLILLDTYGLEKDAKTLSAHMSRGELADLANMTIANTSRVLGEFAQEGLVTVYRSSIAILDKAMLKYISAIG